MTPEQRLVAEIDGRELALSNLDKVLYPATGFTKGDLIAYYVSVGPVLTAHLAGRPATFKRYPDGVERASFFEKHVPRHAPLWVRRVRVPRLGRVGSGGAPDPAGAIDYVVLDEVASLAWAANLATIELHVPMWRADDAGPDERGAGPALEVPALEVPGLEVPILEVVEDVRPDTLVFDLDPGAPATVVECCAVALDLEPRLQALGLSGVAKTSGRKGLQVYAALRPPRPWLDVHDLAHDLARAIELDSGGLVISNMRRDRREGKVLVDWSQNHPAKTTVAPYSMRAGDRPSVSTPLSWEEVERGAAGDAEALSFGPFDVIARVEELGDLFAPIDARP